MSELGYIIGGFGCGIGTALVAVLLGMLIRQYVRQYWVELEKRLERTGGKDEPSSEETHGDYQ